MMKVFTARKKRGKEEKAQEGIEARKERDKEEKEQETEARKNRGKKEKGLGKNGQERIRKSWKIKREICFKCFLKIIIRYVHYYIL